MHSLVDSPGFFLSPRGRTDPQAELEATLASFWSLLEETPQQQNPQCAFIARRAWLDAELGFDRARLPLRNCPRYEAWRAALNAGRLTLVFASAHLNNPSSMYGHTLLRIDARDQDERTRLLAYTLNFAADTEETNGIVFAINGLFGGYVGTFSLLPYYLKVREYNDMENRDLWEYELALAPEELERVLAHAWELRPTYFRYFFFDENCSYHLLGLLQVARAGLELTRPFRWWALPVDTVRAVTREPGLVARAVFRPSNATLIRARLAALAEEERNTARQLAVGAAEPAVAASLPPQRAAAVLEAAHTYASYRRVTGEAAAEDPARLERELLVARSRVDVPSQVPAVEPPARPDEGHATARLTLGAGRRAGHGFQELGLRASYHDVLDTQAGYVRGAQIQFFELAVRRLAERGVRLERFVPVDILSLAPRDGFFTLRSWHLSGGWEQRLLRSGERLVGRLDGGLGTTWEAGHALAYATADAALLQHHELRQGYALGVGATLGLLAEPGPRWRVHAYAKTLAPLAGETDRPRVLALRQSLALGRDSALRLELSRRREAARSYGAALVALALYF